MKAFENFDLKAVPVWQIETVITSVPDYEMERAMLVEHYPEYNQYTVITGGHCSCYDFNETSWTAIIYTYTELFALFEGWVRDSWGPEKVLAELWLEHNKR